MRRRLEPAPLVSVLLPACNAAPTLATALRSVTRQTYARLECVVVDDGSSDGTAAIVDAFARRDARFVVHRLGRRHGLVAALDHGLEACRGAIVARMDADDLMHRRRLELQVRALSAAPELCAVGCHVRLFPRSALGPGRRAYEAWLNAIDSPDRVRAEAFVECPIAHPTLAIRRDVLAQVGYRDVDWPEDYDLVLRLLARGFEIGVVPRRLLAWRHRPDRLSLRSARYAIDRFTACKAAFLADGFLRNHAEYVLWGYGHTGRALRRALVAHGKRPSHVIELHPGRVGNVIHGAPVVAPDRLGDLPRQPIVVSVAGVEARCEIRTALARSGFSETRDFVCAA